ncbi:MAG: hypothetical protein AAF821_20055 [Cyanobacteria bacterium P01_D01_bin.156]
MSPLDGLIHFLTYQFPFLKGGYFSFVSDESILYLHCDSMEHWGIIYRYRDQLSELDVGIENLVVTRPKGSNVWIKMSAGNACE